MIAFVDPPIAIAVVTGFYYDLLHRQPSPAELAGWTSALQSGIAPVQIAQGFLNSAEFRTTVVRTNYERLLGRDPSPQELFAWLNEMKTGVGVQQLTASLLASDLNGVAGGAAVSGG